MISNPSKTFKDFTNCKKETNRTVVFSRSKSGKQNSFRHILKSSAGMYGSSGSQFFRTTTGIQSGPDTFDESRFVMVFLTIVRIMEILFNFRLALEGKRGKEIAELPRLEFLKKFLANNFVLFVLHGNKYVLHGNCLKSIY